MIGRSQKKFCCCLLMVVREMFEYFKEPGKNFLSLSFKWFLVVKNLLAFNKMG